MGFCLLPLLGALLAAGCGPRDAGPAAPAGAVRGRIVLDFWNGFTGPDGKTMEALVRQFRVATPDVDVRMQIIPWGTYYDKLTLSLAYGGAPDVFILHASRLPEFASYDVLRPLGDLFASTRPPLDPRRFAPVPWGATFWGRKQYALPLDVHPLGLYYNTQLFKQAGIVDAAGRARPPATWDEFLADAKRLTVDTDGDGRPDRWGFVIANEHSNWYAIAEQFGGGIMSPDGRRCIMESPPNRTALDRMHDLVYRYRVAPKPEGVDAWLAFRQGKVGMAMEGIYMLASLEEQKGLAFAGAPVPQFGPRPATWGNSHLLCQPAGIAPERARAAWRFMRFLSDHSLLWGAGGQVPARRDIVRSKAFQALPVPSQFARELPYVRYEPRIPKANALGQFVDPAIEAVLLNLQSPDAALRDAQRRIDQVLSRP